MLILKRAQSLRVSEANTLYEDTHQAKNDALHANYAKLSVVPKPKLHFRSNTIGRFAPPKLLRSKQRSVKTEAEELHVTTST